MTTKFNVCDECAAYIVNGDPTGFDAGEDADERMAACEALMEHAGWLTLSDDKPGSGCFDCEGCGETVYGGHIVAVDNGPHRTHYPRKYAVVVREMAPHLYTTSAYVFRDGALIGVGCCTGTNERSREQQALRTAIYQARLVRRANSFHRYFRSEDGGAACTTTTRRVCGSAELIDLL